jgi:hypothetical protein
MDKKVPLPEGQQSAPPPQPPQPPAYPAPQSAQHSILYMKNYKNQKNKFKPKPNSLSFNCPIKINYPMSKIETE